jgi:Flp pilus assembly protein CpaB
VSEMTARGPGTRTVLQNVKVLAIGHRLDPTGDKIALGRLATIEVSPAEVELLASIERTTPLMLSLRARADTSVVKIEHPVTPAIIITGR